MTSPHVSSFKCPSRLYMAKIGNTYRVYKTRGAAQGQITTYLNNFKRYNWNSENLLDYGVYECDVEWRKSDAS